MTSTFGKNPSGQGFYLMHHKAYDIVGLMISFKEVSFLPQTPLERFRPLLVSLRKNTPHDSPIPPPLCNCEPTSDRPPDPPRRTTPFFAASSLVSNLRHQELLSRSLSYYYSQPDGSHSLSSPRIVRTKISYFFFRRRGCPSERLSRLLFRMRDMALPHIESLLLSSPSMALQSRSSSAEPFPFFSFFVEMALP